MAFHHNPIYKDFRGSVNRQLVFKQFFGRTLVCGFPDRSKVIYSTRQKEEQNRFKDAVGFARIVISNKVLKDSYRLKASRLGLRSAWNAAIADFMSKGELRPKPKKVWFDKSITDSMGKEIYVRLYKLIPPEEELSPAQRHYDRIVSNKLSANKLAKSSSEAGIPSFLRINFSPAVFSNEWPREEDCAK